MSYKGPEHKNKVMLVLVPGRELSHDLCQYAINTGSFGEAAVLWLRRPPLGRTAGLWDECVADSIRHIQKQKLYATQAQRKTGLDEVAACDLGRGRIGTTSWRTFH